MVDDESSDPFINDEDFSFFEGKRMCPRCQCCSVGVGKYEPPTFPGGKITWLRVLSSKSSLLSEPPKDSDEALAWYCVGACDEEGKHGPRRWDTDAAKLGIVSFVGRVKPAS